MNYTRSSVRTVGISKEESRLKRENQTLSLRKKARDELFSKRRRGNDGLNPISMSSYVEPEVLQSIAFHQGVIYSSDIEEVKKACHEFRKLLSDEKNPPIGQVIEAGIVPRFIECTMSEDEILQYEALWCLTNIASGSHAHVEYLVSLEFLPKVMEMTSSPNPKIREQACWLIGNIAGDCIEYRDLVLSLNGMPIILELLSGDTLKVSLVRTAIWTISNLCRGQPPPSYSIIKDALSSTCKLIYSTDREILVDALWTLSFLSDGKSKKQKAVVQYNVTHRLISLLGSNDLHIIVPDTRIIGNLLSGDNQTTQTLIDAGVLPALKKLLSHEERLVRKEACWGISNIMAGTVGQIQSVIDEDIVPILLHILKSDTFEVRREASWCLSNAISEANGEQIITFVNYNCIAFLCESLKIKDIKLIQMTLEAIEKTLKVGELIASKRNLMMNPYLDLIYGCGGLDTIESLMNHDNESVSGSSQYIVMKYFRKESIASQLYADKESYDFQVDNQTHYDL